jgi:hypothetical protein
LRNPTLGRGMLIRCGSFVTRFGLYWLQRQGVARLAKGLK